MSAWMITITGKDHYLSITKARDNAVDIYDIAHALSIVNRFSGHTKRPLSVVEHQLLVADLAADDGKSALVQLACLTHDGHEAYTGDCSSPAKNVIGMGWATFESHHADHVRRTFGLTTAFQSHRALIHHYDLVALATERAQLTTHDPAKNLAWPILDTPGAQVPPASWVNLHSLERISRRWDEWRDLYLVRFFDLMRAVQADAKALTTTNHPATQEL